MHLGSCFKEEGKKAFEAKVVSCSKLADMS
jgi:hypothetical protein